MIRRAIILVLAIHSCFIAHAAQPVSSQPATNPMHSASLFEPQMAESVFRVGYLPEPGEGGMNEALAHKLRLWLENNQKFRLALHDAGFSGQISLQAADGHNDLRNHLENAQFHMAFAPAAVFASLRKQYRVVLQEKRQGDVWDSRGGGQVFRQGVLFVGPQSPHFPPDQSTSDTLRLVGSLLRQSDLAVPSVYDAAGYHYPLLAIANQLGVRPSDIHLRICGSSEEVVKHVVSGLAPIGACDRSVLETWLPKILPADLSSPQEGIPDQVVRVLPIEIAPVPSDPVIILTDLRPEISVVGRVLKEELPKFFRPLPDPPFTLDGRAMNESYDRLWADLELLNSLTRGEVLEP